MGCLQGQILLYAAMWIQINDLFSASSVYSGDELTVQQYSVLLWSFKFICQYRRGNRGHQATFFLRKIFLYLNKMLYFIKI